MNTTVAERFHVQDAPRSQEIEDLLLECEILQADPIVSQSWKQLDLSPTGPPDVEHWELFLDQVCNRGVDLDGTFVDRGEWLYEDCYLSDQQLRSNYWWQDREATPARDVRFNA